MEKTARSLPFFKSTTSELDWDQIFQTNLPALYRFFIYSTGDPNTAEELSAITLERAWRLRKRYRSERAGLSTWLFGIARKVLLEHYRSLRKYSREEALDEGIGDQSPAPETVADLEQEKAALRKGILALPDRERQIIALSYGSGLSHRQIGRILGLSETNVGTILHRSLAQLRIDKEL
jgi:RNA polymerase sigma factor (sigma-70 family)